MHIITIIKQQQWFWELNPEDKGIRWLRPGQVNYELMKSSKYLDTLFNTLFNIQTCIWQNLQYLCTLPFYNIILILHLTKPSPHGQMPEVWLLLKNGLHREKRSLNSENMWLFGHFKNENAELKAWMTTLPKTFSRLKLGEGIVP